VVGTSRRSPSHFTWPRHQPAGRRSGDPAALWSYTRSPTTPLLTCNDTTMINLSRSGGRLARWRWSTVGPGACTRSFPRTPFAKVLGRRPVSSLPPKNRLCRSQHNGFGKRPTAKDPTTGHLTGGRLHSEGARRWNSAGTTPPANPRPRSGPGSRPAHLTTAWTKARDTSTGEAKRIQIAFVEPGGAGHHLLPERALFRFQARRSRALPDPGGSDQICSVSA